MTSETMLEGDGESTELIVHTPSSPYATPRSGRRKKKGALARLAEKKKRVEAGLSEVESNYGSAISLQSENDMLLSDSYLKAAKESNCSVFDNDTSVHSFSSIIDRKPFIKPKSDPSAADDRFTTRRQNSRVIVDEISDASNTAIHKLRALKMTPSRSASSESLKNSQFSPRPPSSPRKTPSGYRKEDKLTKERLVSVISQQESSGVHENLTDLSYVGKKDDSVIEGMNNLAKASSNSHQNAKNGSIEELDQVDSAPSNLYNSNLQFANESATLLNLENASDIGSTTDLQGLSEHYREVLSKDSCNLTSARSLPPGLSSRTGRLTPLSPRHPPPILPMDYTSTALRTSNKTDKSFRAHNGRAGLMTGEKGFDTISHSMASTSALPLVTTREAKSRSYLLGSINNSALLGAEELDRYFPDRKLHVFVGCWNMAELKECSASLDEFILPDNTEFVQDLYVIGTQENNTNKKEWEIKIQETLGPSHVLLHSATHGALHLAVFIRRDLIWFCSVPESDIVTTRAVTMVKTKGAVAISFTFFGTSFLFINSHFTSDDSKMKNRIADYKKIIRELNLPKVSAASPKGPSNPDDVTQKFDAVFWCGDLNFRIDRHRDHVESMLMVVTSQLYPNFENLIASDQLTKCINQGQIFAGFQEGRIGFKPTYKFDMNSDIYDTSHKLRIPSYTDRVLFRSKKKNGTSCILYDAAMSVKASDHRPVFGLFETALRPGRDTIPLAAGQFDRSVYIEANKRRALCRAAKPQNHKSSAICSLQ